MPMGSQAAPLRQDDDPDYAFIEWPGEVILLPAPQAQQAQPMWGAHHTDWRRPLAKVPPQMPQAIQSQVSEGS